MKELEEAYNQCIAEGIIRKKDEVDIEMAKSLLISAKEELESSKKI